jgi:hypothetical protein
VVAYLFEWCGCCGKRMEEPTNSPWALCNNCTESKCDFVSQKVRCGADDEYLQRKAIPSR